MFVRTLVRRAPACEHGRRAAAFGEPAAQAGVRRAREREAAAIAAERARIGGELQDIIAHSVSAMVIQAGGARLLLHGDPDRARDSILNVEHTGREALADLRRLLGMLRKDDDPRAHAPTGAEPARDADRLDPAGRPGVRAAHGGQPYRTDPRSRPGRRPSDRGGATRPPTIVSIAAESMIRYSSYQLELEVSGDGSIPDLEQNLTVAAQRRAVMTVALERCLGGLRRLHASGLY